MTELTEVSKRSLRARKIGGRSILYLVLTAIAVVTLIPLVYAFFASFKNLPELLSSGAALFPKDWTVGNYVQAWQGGGFSRYFLNSIVVTVGLVVFDAFASSMLGYVLARKLVPFGRVITSVMGAVMFIGLGTATLYPRVILAQWLGINNLFGIIVVELANVTVIHTFLMRGFCSAIPPELEEAARVDGCGVWRAYWRIIFPLLIPIVTTTAILAFQAGWNNFQVAYVFTFAQPTQRTLVVGVYMLRSTGEGGSQAYGLMLAGAMIVVVPIVIVFVILQRYFVRGLTEGSVKG